MGVLPTVPRSGMRGGGKNPHDVFVNLDGAIYIATNSKKEKAAALISWLVKKGVEKLQEEHQKTRYNGGLADSPPIRHEGRR